MGGRPKGTRGLMSKDEVDSRYRFIWEYNKQNGMMPTYKELGEAWNVTSSVVQHTLKKFRAFGWLTMHFRTHRSIELLRQLD